MLHPVYDGEPKQNILDGILLLRAIQVFSIFSIAGTGFIDVLEPRLLNMVLIMSTTSRTLPPKVFAPPVTATTSSIIYP